MQYLVGNLDGVIAHTKGLHQMLSMRSPLPTKTAWDRFVKTGVEACATSIDHWSMTNRRRYKSIGYFAAGRTIGVRGSEHPVFANQVDLSKSLTYCSSPVPDEFCSVLTEIPPGFADLVLSGQISTQLISLISMIQGLHCDPSTILRRDDPIFPGSATHQLQAALSRFTQHSQITHLEKCIVAGLTAYAFQFPRRVSLNLFHDPPMQGFIQTLSRPYRPGPDIERHVFIWIAMTVEGVMAVRSSRLPGSRGIFNKALDMHADMLKWETLESIIKRFFWSVDVMRHWKLCWEAGQQEYMITQTGRSADESTEMSRQSDSGLGFDSPNSSAVELPSWHPSPSSYTAEVQLCPFRT